MRTQSASLVGFFVVGLVGSLIARAIKRTREDHDLGNARHPRPPDRDDPRWGPSDGRVQIAGKDCAACGERITLASEGEACDACRKPCHHKCITRHTADAHKLHDEGTPYR
jgi:hypothetical protein